ncbi:TauD/TfdA dioxygenase family protein [Sphingomonas lycopersici]|uniref:TauD/TfdA family dioxygenase n=1 Tax=Sphingomonas lycopersici TaxID=2951807 RepID=A0AA42CSM9_9SPHN|nr:TauD/TfdA family dioxygenase [Sphingomonas lycopersici]
MPLTVKPILPRFGAEVSGVDLTRPLDPAMRREIVDTMNRWGVCVYRDTGLDDESHIAFSRIFGHLELAPAMKDRPRRHRYPELFDASNLTRDGEIVRDENLLLHKKGDRLWHTDSSFMEMRSSYSLLLAYEVPSQGGETWFADTRSAYDDLPTAMKARIDGLEAEHSLWWSRKLAGFPLSEADVDARPKARHPLVLDQPATGRKALYIASHAIDIVGLPRDEGQALIRELIDFATQPQYIFSVKWQPGDLVIWDNLTSMHRGGDFDVRNERRDMRRTTVREGPPPADADDPFGAYFRASLDRPTA